MAYPRRAANRAAAFKGVPAGLNGETRSRKSRVQNLSRSWGTTPTIDGVKARAQHHTARYDFLDSEFN